VIVLDASVLIAYLDSDDSHHAAAEALLAEAVTTTSQPTRSPSPRCSSPQPGKAVWISPRPPFAHSK